MLFSGEAAGVRDLHVQLGSWILSYTHRWLSSTHLRGSVSLRSLKWTLMWPSVEGSSACLPVTVANADALAWCTRSLKVSSGDVPASSLDRTAVYIPIVSGGQELRKNSRDSSVPVVALEEVHDSATSPVLSEAEGQAEVVSASALVMPLLKLLVESYHFHSASQSSFTSNSGVGSLSELRCVSKGWFGCDAVADCLREISESVIEEDKGEMLVARAVLALAGGRADVGVFIEEREGISNTDTDADCDTDMKRNAAIRGVMIRAEEEVHVTTSTSALTGQLAPPSRGYERGVLRPSALGVISCSNTDTAGDGSDADSELFHVVCVPVARGMVVLEYPVAETPTSLSLPPFSLQLIPLICSALARRWHHVQTLSCLTSQAETLQMTLTAGTQRERRLIEEEAERREDQEQWALVHHVEERLVQTAPVCVERIIGIARGSDKVREKRSRGEEDEDNKDWLTLWATESVAGLGDSCVLLWDALAELAPLMRRVLGGGGVRMVVVPVLSEDLARAQSEVANEAEG